MLELCRLGSNVILGLFLRRSTTKARQRKAVTFKNLGWSVIQIKQIQLLSITQVIHKDVNFKVSLHQSIVHNVKGISHIDKPTEYLLSTPRL